VALTKALTEAAAAETKEPQELKDDKVTGMFVRVAWRTKAPVAYVRFSKGVGRSAKRVERKVGEVTPEFPLDAARREALRLQTAGRDGTLEDNFRRAGSLAGDQGPFEIVRDALVGIREIGRSGFTAGS